MMIAGNVVDDKDERLVVIELIGGQGGVQEGACGCSGGGVWWRRGRVVEAVGAAVIFFFLRC